MKTKDVPSASLEQLIDAYRRAAPAHYHAIDNGDAKTANRHSKLGIAIRRELRARGLEAQQALLPLLQDPAVRHVTSSRAAQVYRHRLAE